MVRIDVTVHSGGATQQFRGVRLPLELGRQRQDDHQWLTVQNLGDRHRIAIAPLKCVVIPREAVRVESEGGELRLTNVHARSTFAVNNQPLPPGGQVSVSGELVLQLSEDVVVQLKSNDGEMSSIGDDQLLRTLTGQVEDAEFGDEEVKVAQLLDKQDSQEVGKVAIGLIRQALDVVKKSTGSDEYFSAAVRNTANMIELDRAYVITRSGGSEWSVRAKYAFDSDTSVRDVHSEERKTMPSGSGMILDRLVETRRTVLYEPSSYMHTTGSSMMMLDRAVAAPMLNQQGEVIGALYGDRRFGSERGDRPIGELEATLLEIMAGAVATGLARQREESLRTAMNQYFSPSVITRLANDDNLLVGRDAEVTVLFCDIRGFSAITERVGPERTIEWINDVLTELSRCVIETDGVLVDYVGDELLAMWGAPAEQPNHAQRACEAALAMLEQTEPLRNRWADITPDHFGFGIGINTGLTRVGNTGSSIKFKYGPLGSTVNVASRIQGMTKKFGVRVLASESTRRAVEDEPFAFRRVADVQPLGVQEIVRLHQLSDARADGWSDMCGRYERALECYHNRDLTGAIRDLATLVHQYPDDTPSVQLLGRVVNSLTKGRQDYDPVIQFHSK